MSEEESDSPGKSKGKGKMGESEGDPKSEGQAKENKAKGKNDSIVSNTKQGPDPQEGARLFSKTAPKDGMYNRDSARWNYLGDRERTPVMERYIDDLPLEYRDLLRQYYESLAK